jgi:demethylmenaquinone methyltransferase/2-methoxy-6-polyprenyl-1,4-benzoquinol methylase
MNNDFQQDKVFCGSKLVTKSEKKSFVQDVFSSVSDKYDLMNDLMSFGMHRIWKNHMIQIMKKKIFFKKNPLILDIASGSGDISIKFLKKYYFDKNFNNEIKIILSDINPEMLKKAKEKVIDENLIQFCDFEIQDMTNFSFQHEIFDLAVVSFGIRNSPDISKSLEEVYRILKPNSSFICMEFSPNASNFFIQKIYDLYSENLIPCIGEKIAKDRNSYQYLVESIKTFPNKNEFKSLLLNAGFENIEMVSLNFGLVTIFIAQKL